MKETKVYVDELPESCWDCPCFKNDLEFQCGLSDGTQDFFKDEIDGENCPIIDIKAHDRELVKEVCEKIKNLANEKSSIDTRMLDMVYFDDVVEKIKKEFEK